MLVKLMKGLMLLLLCLPAAAEVYRLVDKDGSITYTDQPQADAQVSPIVLPHLNKMKATVPTEEPQSDVSETIQGAEKTEVEPTFAGYSRAVILAPNNNEVIPNQQRNIIIQLSVEPQLQTGHRIQFWIDGKAQGAPVSATSYQMNDLERGSHNLSAQIVNDQGRVLISAGSVEVHIQRHFKRDFKRH